MGKGEILDVEGCRNAVCASRWSWGESETRVGNQTVWTVYCYRGGHRLVSKGAIRLEAWQAAVRMVGDVSGSDG